ncbi:TRIO and F-actin-binding protein isoform X16 [Symphalangus syndactylus]|uniref:TRIO and F-actin-binding protein isoform X16 n=1 Tax=Symphalangus syndactylus TaxID=9590 RepID=UPI003004BA63
MEEVPGDDPCEHFEANMLTQNHHQNCFHPEEAHGARYQELRSPSGAEVPYCDLPRCPPAPEDPLSASTSGCQSVVDPGLRPGPKRGPSPSAGLPEEGPTAAPRSGSRELEAVPYLEGLTTSLCGSCNEDPGSDPTSSPDSATPDDTSNSSSVDWDTVERQEEAPSWDELAVMIPRRPREAPRADSSQRAPSLLTRSPVGGDTAGQKKEDTGGGGQSAGQRWARLRGESGFSLERRRSTLTQASSMTPHSGPRSTTFQASPAQRDTAQAASTCETPRASSPHRITQRDTSRASSTQQDTPRASSTQWNTPRASSPSRSTQQDNPRTSSTQQDNLQTSFPTCTPQRENPRIPCVQQDDPKASSPNRTTQRENSRTSCAQRDNPGASSPIRATQQDNPRISCAQRDNPGASSPNRTIQRDSPRTSCAQRDIPRASSPNRTIQQENPRTSCARRDNPRASSPIRATQQDNPRISCAQRDNPGASSPNRTIQRDSPRTSCARRDNPGASSPNRTIQRDSPRTSCAQRDIPRASSPNRTIQQENPRTSCARRDNPRASSPIRATQQDNPRISCAQRDNPGASSPNRTIQRDSPRTSCARRDNPGASSPNRTTQRDSPRTSCAQRDIPRASSPNRTIQQENPRTSCARRDNPRASSPNRTIQRDSPRTSCAQRDIPRASSPIRATQQDNPRTCIQQNIPRSSSTQQDNPKTSCTKRDNLRPTCTQRDRTQSFSFQRDNPGTSSSQCCTQKENLRPSSPHRSTQWNNPRNSSPHRTNKDIPWASFPLRPTHSDGPRTSSPSRSKQSEVPWASIALRPTQGDRPQTSSPSRPAQHDPPQSSFGPTQYNLPSRATSSSHNPGHQSTSRTSSPVYPAAYGAPLTSPEPSQPPCAVCIGHRDAPRASSPPRYLQHDPFPFFPEPRAPESELPHHEPPYIPPAVCIGHRDAPRASSPPRHTQFDPFPFLPDTSDAEHQCQSPQHEPLQLPAPVCIGYRDAPRASSPPRQVPEPSLLFQDLPRASTESLVPSMDSMHECPHIPTPVCIGHRDAPSFSSPPRQAPEPSLFFQDPPGTSMESLAPSTDSLHGSPVLIPQVCIGHRDAPRASSPPRHPPSDLAFLAPSPSLGSSGGSRGSAPPGETRHNLEREEYTVLADLPPPRRLAQREPGPQAQCSSGGRTRSPGRAEVERLFGQERRKSEAAGAFQAQDEGRSQQPSQGQSQLLRRQSSPAPSRQFQPEEPEESEPSRGQDPLTDQKQADSPDLLNFKKGWMSILDEPGEPPSPSLTTTSTSQWKKHWFVLTDSSLKYYRDSTAEEWALLLQADELDGEIDLRSCTDVTEYAVQRNYGFQIHTKDAVYTLSAMTSGIRRNWIEALRKTVRPTSAPDVTKLSDSNKENALHSYSTQKGPLKAGEQRAGSEVISRGGPRKADGQRQALDYVELSPLTQASPQRARTPARTPDRLAKQEELERDLAQRSEERRKWFEATDSRTPEVPAGEGPRRGLGAPLTEDQQNRLSEEIEKKWQELEKLPLRENKRVPLTALLNQSRGERRGPPSDGHEALEKEVQALRAQLEAWRLQGEAPQSAPRSQEDGHIPPGYISQEACERSLAEMESSHQQVMEELQRHHERELQRLQQEKEWLLAEETAATASAIEAMKKAYQEELSRELSKTRSLQQGPDGLRKQHQSDVEALKRELQVLSEQYSQKCLEIGTLTRQAEEREHTLRRCQQEGQELLRHNQELHGRLSEEIDQLRGFIASQSMGNGCRRSNERSSCELEVLLRVKENELQYLKKEVQCLRDELQMMQKDKRFTSGKYQDVYVELSHIKTRSEREIEQLKEHLRLAMAALQEKESMRNSLAE